jgi:hypothetical protein
LKITGSAGTNKNKKTLAANARIKKTTKKLNHEKHRAAKPQPKNITESFVTESFLKKLKCRIINSRMIFL